MNGRGARSAMILQTVSDDEREDQCGAAQEEGPEDPELNHFRHRMETEIEIPMSPVKTENVIDILLPQRAIIHAEQPPQRPNLPRAVVDLALANIR